MDEKKNEVCIFEKENKTLDVCAEMLEKYDDKNSTIKIEQNKRIKQLFKENLTNEAVQGFIKIFLASHVTIKIFWAISLIVANGLCSYLVIQSILTYLSYGVSTSSRAIVENPSPFPKITICNNNQFTTEYSLNFIKAINRELLPTINIFDETQMKNLSYTNKSETINIIYNAAISKMLSKNFSDIERKKLGHSLEEILFACSFNNQLCTKDDFVWKFDRYYGNCYVFNSGFNSSGHSVDKKMSLIAGYKYGLQLEFYIGFNENLTVFNSIAGKGGYARIENSSYLNDDTLDGIFLTPGLSPTITIARKFAFNLPKPYSNCEIENDSPKNFNSDLYNLIYYSPYTYNQQLCFNQCLQKKLIQECNCSDPQSLSLFNSITCETNEQQNCMNDRYNKILLKNNFIQNECLPFCPLECNRTEYSTSISSIEIIGDLYVDFLKSNTNLSSDFVMSSITPETAKNNFAYIYLYYDSLSYTISTETPQMDIVALLANIGGTLGLFLGVSLLHLCEVIEVIIEIIFIKTDKKVHISF